MARQMGQEAQEVKLQLRSSKEKVDNAVMVIHHLITTLDKEVKRRITAEQLASELQEQILEANTKISQQDSLHSLVSNLERQLNAVQEELAHAKVGLADAEQREQETAKKLTAAQELGAELEATGAQAAAAARQFQEAYHRDVDVAHSRISSLEGELMAQRSLVEELEQQLSSMHAEAAGAQQTAAKTKTKLNEVCYANQVTESNLVQLDSLVIHSGDPGGEAENAIKKLREQRISANRKARKQAAQRCMVL